MSVFECGTCLIDLSRVAFVERVCEGEICVVLQGAIHPIDAQGQLIGGQGRADCPYLSGEDAERFLAAWREYAERGSST